MLPMYPTIYLPIVCILLSTSLLAQQDSVKTAADTTRVHSKQLQGSVVTAKKQAVERRADRTIFDFSQQANLNSGSLMDGLKKLPGLIISDITGLVYQGKQLEVYLDGRPLNIYSDELNSYLSGMPANSIERVEIITQPGAEFPATSGGAIINIISSRYYSRYLSATYSSGYRFSDYEKYRSRFNNSLMIQTGSKLLSWQMRIGQSYNEGFREDKYSFKTNLNSINFSDRTLRYYFLESGLKFDLGKDRILLNYNLGVNNNRSDVRSNGLGFVGLDQGQIKGERHDLALDYQKRFTDVHRKLNFKLNYIHSLGSYTQKDLYTYLPRLDNAYTRDYYQAKVDYSQRVKLLDESKILLGALAERVDYSTEAFGLENMNYQQNTAALYTEAQTQYHSWEFILGARCEHYDLGGEVTSGSLLPFVQTRFFPNATLQYNLAPKVFVNVSYNQKIKLPSTSALNPNNNVYQNPNISFGGNPNLRPTLYQNYAANLSVYEYFTIGYSQQLCQDEIMFRLLEDNNGVQRSYTNISECTVQNFNIGVPLPYMVFTQGIKKTLEFDFNPDEINFLYAYFGYEKQSLPDIETKGVWFIYLMSQIILPGKVNFTATYNTSTINGNYYYIRNRKPFDNNVELNFSRKFDENRLSVAVFVNDVLNTNQKAYAAAETSIEMDRRYDSRRFGININYKIPTRRKANKNPENILLNPSKDNGNNEKGI